MRRNIVSALVIAIVATTAVYGDAKFKSTWKAPDVGTLDFAGKKVAAIVITDDLSLQMSAEEALAGELSRRGVQGAASYRIIPKEELVDPAKAKAWFTKGNVAGAVVMRVVGSEKETIYTPTVWATAYYSSFWNYYGTSWTAVRSYKTRQSRNVTIETLVFDVTKDKLLWAAVSETTDAKSAQSVVRDLVNETAIEMRKAKFLPDVKIGGGGD